VKRVPHSRFENQSYYAARWPLSGLALLHVLRKGQMGDAGSQALTAAAQFDSLAA